MTSEEMKEFCCRKGKRHANFRLTSMSDELRKNLGGEEIPAKDPNKENLFFSMDEGEEVPETSSDHALTDEMEAILDEMISQNAQDNEHVSGAEEEALADIVPSPVEIKTDISDADKNPDEFGLHDLDEEDDEFDEELDLPPKKEEGKSRKVKENKSKKKTKEKPERARASFFQVVVRFFLVMMCLGIIAGCVLGVLVALYLADATADDNKLLDINQIKLSLATRLMAYDNEKQEWYEYERLYSDENRLWVEYGDLPGDLIKAIVASEDQRFWTHHGVDWKRTAFAFINEYIHRMSESTQGGSTITQQLIKNITSDKAVSGIDGVLRKLREIYRALELEKNYSKEQILEAYLNTFRLGDQVAGIESAANYYFGKHASQLSMAESAAIVCITKYPSSYNPYTNPDENHRQRNYVLYNMMDYGMITEAEYKRAKAESDAMVFDEANKTSSSTSSVYSYFTDAVIIQILDDFQNLMGMSRSEANNLLFQGGLTIYLTVDPKIQETVEATAFNKELWPELEYEEDGVTPKENQIEAAMVVMNYDGEVLGIAGGIREKTVSRSLNRAITSTRQTGSSMKPIAVYGPAIELKKVHYSTLLPDAKFYDDESGKPWPRNFSNTYGSPVTVYRGVVLSLNTIAVHTMNLIGADFSFDFLTSSLGFTTLVDSRWDESQGKYLTDRTYSMGLGGLTDGATVMEMTAAYAIFGDGGVYTTPHLYTQVFDKSGDVLLDKTRFLTKSAAISEETAEIMNHIMRGVLTEGTGTRAYFKGMPLAGKSGTSSDNNDYWFVGMNPYYVCGVWMGYDQNGPMTPYSIHFDTQIAFKDIMSTISEGLEEKDFPTTGNLVQRAFCLSSGYLASEGCPDTRVGWYTTDNMPRQYCNHALFAVPAVEPAA